MTLGASQSSLPQVLRQRWRDYWLMWVYPSIGALGGAFGEKLHISQTLFTAVMLPLFFYAVFCALRPQLRGQVTLATTISAAFVLPIVLLALTVAAMLLIGSLCVRYAL